GPTRSFATQSQPGRGGQTAPALTRNAASRCSTRGRRHPTKFQSAWVSYQFLTRLEQHGIRRRHSQPASCRRGRVCPPPVLSTISIAWTIWEVHGRGRQGSCQPSTGILCCRITAVHHGVPPAAAPDRRSASV